MRGFAVVRVVVRRVGLDGQVACDALCRKLLFVLVWSRVVWWNEAQEGWCNAYVGWRQQVS
jgi:hypothetical protein